MSRSSRRRSPGVLYIIATPIGNLEDITYRAVRLLSEVDLVAAEDTRHSRKLLSHYGIQNRLLSYHEHNEDQRTAQMVERLLKGTDIALICDAGTPCIADPGYQLVRAAHAAGIRVVPVPGPSALMAALSSAGLPTDRFAFEGYLPPRTKARQDLLRQLCHEPRTLVFYEAPHRLSKALKDCVDILGMAREIVVARELTKLHEELYSGSMSEALQHFEKTPIKGECVLVVSGAEVAPAMDMLNALQTMLAESGLSRREIVKLIAREYGVSSSEVYRVSLRLEEGLSTDESENQGAID